jgi:hypothetical protein
MGTPMLTCDEIADLVQQVSQYISSQRIAYLDVAAPIQSTHRDSIAGFFPIELLAITRITAVAKPVDNPPFYPALRQRGFYNLPDFSTMAAITFVDVIVSHVPITSALLFHEMVHAVQYTKLGLNQFSRHYVEGFLYGGCYERIPLEMNAYQLEERFKANPGRSFSVEAEVQQWVSAGKF